MLENACFRKTGKQNNRQGTVDTVLRNFAEFRPVLMVIEYTSEKSAHAHSELENVKKLTVMGTKSAPKKVEVSGVYC